MAGRPDPLNGRADPVGKLPHLDAGIRAVLVHLGRAAADFDAEPAIRLLNSTQG
jgi:hypothetical protein